MPQNASSAPHKTTTSQLKHALVVENMSYTDSMFRDIYLHSPVHPLNCDGLWIKSSESNSKCGHLSSRGDPLWVISCEEMFPAAHEFIMHYTPPPGAAKIPALVDILKPVCAIYPVDLPAACQGTSSTVILKMGKKHSLRFTHLVITWPEAMGSSWEQLWALVTCTMKTMNAEGRICWWERVCFQNCTGIIREHSQGHTADMFSKNETRGLWRTVHGGFVLILYRDEMLTCCRHVKKENIS